MKSRSKFFEKPACASALALSTLAIALPVAAQEQQTSENVDEIVVTGIRRQLETSQARKQEAPELVDAVTADDIGALPDRSVTEVLQRIPGLAIGRVPAPRDADRIAVEGAGVTIRGLSWVRSELNGHSAFSAKNSRTLGFEDIPPELLAGVDVYKNPSAMQIEGGLSGSVNLRTRLPFDSEGRKFSFSVEGARGDLAKEWEPSGSALVQRPLRRPAPVTFGALASASYSDLTSPTDTIHIEKYYVDSVMSSMVTATTSPSGPARSPMALEASAGANLTIVRNRTGASAALQWKSPNDKVDAQLQYFYSDATFEQDENAIWNLPGGGLSGTNLVFDGDYLVGGNFNDGGYAGSARYNKRETRNNDVSLHLNFECHRAAAFRR